MTGVEEFILLTIYLSDGEICYRKLRNLVLIGIAEGVLTDVSVSRPDIKNTYLHVPSITHILEGLKKKGYIDIYGSNIFNSTLSITEKGYEKTRKMIMTNKGWTREAVSVIRVWMDAHPYTVLYYVFTKFRELYPRDHVPIILYREPDQCSMR